MQKTPPACLSSHRLSPWIENAYTAVDEIFFVAGDEGKIVDESGGGDLGVWYVYGEFFATKRCCENAPYYGFFGVEDDDLVQVYADDVFVEPVFEEISAGALHEFLDAAFDFANSDGGHEPLVVGDGEYRVDRVRILFWRDKLGQSAGVK